MKPVATNAFFFKFENDFVETLRCVPMVVRYKLDICGVKLKLPEWAKFSKAEKKELAYMPCCLPAEIAIYRRYVENLVLHHFGHGASALPPVDDVWANISAVPEEVQRKAAEWECPPIALQDWINLDILQRFALIKLSRSGHEGRNFPIALKEFGIV